jgi:hypothetical protein
MTQASGGVAIGELVARVLDACSPNQRVEILRADEHILIADELLHPNLIRLDLPPGIRVSIAGLVTYRLTGERDIGGAWHAIRVET